MGMLLLNGSTDFNPRTLFANNEQGLWLDPSDMTATKAGWRRNLLGYTEQLNNSYWFLSNATVTANAATPPGESSAIADKVIATAASGQHTIESAVVMTAGFVYTATVTAKADGIRYLTINSQGVASQGACFDLQNGTLAIAAGVFVTATNITNLGGGWYTITMTFTNSWGRLSLSLNNSASNAFDSYAGDGVNGILLTKVQLELASSASEYQPITDFSTEFKAAFPTHTLYQDSNGVTPCTAAGDPVGLILDQSRGGLSQIGADLVTNGTFAADTDWTKGANWTIGSGVATKTGGAANNLTQTIGSIAAAWYRITLDVTRSAGTLTISLGTSGTTYAITATGSYTFFILAGSGTQTLTLAGDSSFAGTVDNVVVRNVPGNHAYQSSSSARPTLARIPSSGRRNLLTRTEEFDNAAWVKTLSSITQNSTTAPDGSSTADTITASAQYGNTSQSSIQAGTSFTFSVYAKKSGFDKIEIGIASSVSYINGFAAYFNLTTGAYVSQRAFGSGYTLSSYSITDVGSGWYRLAVSGTISVSATPVAWIGTTVDSVNGSAFFIWGAQLETGSTATNYQKVTATTDVTESGVGDLWHLVFDGSDDSLVTNSVDFTGTNQMTVIAGVRKLSDAAIGIVAEHGNTVDTLLAAPRGPGPDYGADLRHSGLSSTTGIQTYTAPISNVVSVLLDRSAATIAGQVQLRANGILPGQNNSGTGPIASSNFTNNVIFIGRRNSASLPYNGHLYQLIIRGKTTPTGKLLEAERFAGKKTGVSF